MAFRRRSAPALLFAFALSVFAAPPASAAWFARGDVDSSGDLSITDAVVLLGYLFLGEAKPGCLDAADLDDDGAVEITDAVLVLDHLFLGGPPPLALLRGCWSDPSVDELGCADFPPCSPVGVFYSLDRSWAFSPTAWPWIQSAVIQGISGLKDGDEFAIVTFDAAIFRFPRSDTPAQASAETKAAAIDFIRSVVPGRGSCAKAGLIFALTYANQSTAPNRMIIHISDGLNFCIADDIKIYNEEILSEMQTRNTNQVPIHAITVGAPGEGDEAWMKRLAEENNGQYAQVSPR